MVAVAVTTAAIPNLVVTTVRAATRTARAATTATAATTTPHPPPAIRTPAATPTDMLAEAVATHTEADEVAALMSTEAAVPATPTRRATRMGRATHTAAARATTEEAAEGIMSATRMAAAGPSVAAAATLTGTQPVVVSASQALTGAVAATAAATAAAAAAAAVTVVVEAVVEAVEAAAAETCVQAIGSARSATSTCLHRRASAFAAAPRSRADAHAAHERLLRNWAGRFCVADGRPPSRHTVGGIPPDLLLHGLEVAGNSSFWRSLLFCCSFTVSLCGLNLQ